ncbi:MAG: cell wall metabolism sensor histidine kinase WalK [Candidatus Obscuribacterales bacterium]|nr:cell wall metabolism sensor histidine kinase WalK [Candidatus Obscuribacterales bacterium]
MINDLLDIEKLEAGKMQLLIEELPINELLEKALGDMSSEIDLSEPSENISIAVDRDRMLQALSNLVSHALKTRVGKEHIQLKVEKHADFVEINLEMKGLPIPEHMQERLFDRFGRNISSDDIDDQNSGLALPIAKRIVESHGGKIGVKSDENQKTNIFWMRLPKH